MAKKEADKQSKKKNSAAVKKQPKKKPSVSKSKSVKPEGESVVVEKAVDEVKKSSAKKKASAPKKKPSVPKSKSVKSEGESVVVEKAADEVKKSSAKKKASAPKKSPINKVAEKAKHGDDDDSDHAGGLVKDDKGTKIASDDDSHDVAVKPKKKARVRKSSSAKKKRPVVEPDHPLKKFGPVGSAFIMEHLRTIDYTDIAVFIGVTPAELKEAIEQMGIKVPIERARSWQTVDVGEFVSIDNCARCQVQMSHQAFHVGINECRACYEKNIRFWLERNIDIHIKFPHE